MVLLYQIVSDRIRQYRKVSDFIRQYQIVKLTISQTLSDSIRQQWWDKFAVLQEVNLKAQKYLFRTVSFSEDISNQIFFTESDSVTDSIRQYQTVSDSIIDRIKQYHRLLTNHLEVAQLSFTSNLITPITVHFFTLAIKI